MVPDQDADRRETLLHSAYDAATVRALERPLLDDGVPLMRMAAGAVAEIAARLLDDEGIDLSEARVVVLAGAGDNGGDGLYAAARLAEAARHPDGADRQALVRCWDRCRQGLPLPGADAAGELDGGHFFAWSAGTGRLS